MLHNIFDAHAHYDDKWFDEDRDALLSSMPENGVSYIVNASVDLATAKTAIEYAEKYPFVYACAGIHPEHLDRARVTVHETFRLILTHQLHHVAVSLAVVYHHRHIQLPREPQLLFKYPILYIPRDVPVVVETYLAEGDHTRILQ